MTHPYGPATRPAQRTAERYVLIAAGAVILALTIASFWLSYAHLAEVAGQHGLGSARARQWAWPGTVDAFIVTGELLMLRAGLRRVTDWWAIGLTVTGSVGSIALNVAGVRGSSDGAIPVLDYIVAAVPPTAALLAFGVLMRQIHQLVAPPDGGKGEAASGTGTDSNSETETETGTGTGTGTGTDTGTDSNSGTEAGTEAVSGTETGTETATGTDTGTEANTGTEAGTEAVSGTETGTETATGTGTGTEAGTGTDSDNGTDAETGTGSQGASPGPGGRRPRLTDDEIVDLIRPHVPDALARDGNEAVTRVQLRGIMREHAIPIRNERLTPILARLRTPQPAAAKSNR
ncbi:DUF2637 domain-containing protein [Streptomyces cinereoruber]|uniref:DUF2637 domain-containing protein n=1 Tax=Streptomyces cinereoruber TaxID=67260 RepID=UPI003C309CF5